VDAEIGKELEATVAARRELGPEHDDELIAGFLQRIEHRLERQTPPPPPPPRHTGPITPLVLGSIGLGIPVTAVALSNAPGIGGEIVAGIAWVAIGIANIAIARWR
jgi:hypothetical protein